MQNGGHLKKGAILDFQMATKQQEIILVAFKTYKRTTTHSNWPGLLSFYDQSRRVGAEWRPS